jgi:hypothetical protein
MLSNQVAMLLPGHSAIGVVERLGAISTVAIPAVGFGVTAVTITSLGPVRVNALASEGASAATPETAA